MKIKNTKLYGVKEIIPERFDDFRGSYLELYDSKKFEDVTNVRFIQDDISISKKNVLRGLHGDIRTTKLVTVLKGTGYALIADNRKDSPTYRKWEAFTLSDKNMKMLLLPPGIGNSILAMDEEIIYYYKQDSHFAEGQQFTIKWDDPQWNFWWPIKNPILSMRDERGEYAKD
ncbi:MAG: dTDP-4-dehydrorhamnose 3,5-epimerase [Flammeovirgaceae bacterium]|nr:dTDP-4-dehydrorhamnose 3,5-epimerase [Flammeovirgaceae bacterium]|tara:strand:+ start:91 stop:606 length:516 start_codon:yes stop_codon:yes gene_type:complete